MVVLLGTLLCLTPTMPSEKKQRPTQCPRDIHGVMTARNTTPQYVHCVQKLLLRNSMVGTVIEGVMEEQHSWDGDQEDQDEDVEDSEGVMKLISSRLFAVWDHLFQRGGM